METLFDKLKKSDYYLLQNIFGIDVIGGKQFTGGDFSNVYMLRYKLRGYNIWLSTFLKV